MDGVFVCNCCKLRTNEGTTCKCCRPVESQKESKKEASISQKINTNVIKFYGLKLYNWLIANDSIESKDGIIEIDGVPMG